MVEWIDELDKGRMPMIFLRRKRGMELMMMPGGVLHQCWIDRNGSQTGHTVFIRERGVIYRPVGFEKKAVATPLAQNYGE